MSSSETSPSIMSYFRMGASTSSSPSTLDDSLNHKRSLLTSTATPVKWCGRRNTGQDVCIRLVRSSIADDDGRWSSVLVYVIAHSSRLMACSRYFAAELANLQSLNSTNDVDDDRVNLFFNGDDSVHSLLEVTLHVDAAPAAGYIDCISRMCKPSNTGSLQDIPENMDHIVPLLRAATHMAYDALMSHICSRWQLQERRQLEATRKEGLHLLITTCFRSPKETVKELMTQLLKRAREQHWRPTPTMEQELVAIVNDELKRLLAEASDECDWKTPSNKGKVPDFQKLTRISEFLKALLGAQVASEGVRCLLQYPTIPKFLRSLWSQEDDVVAVVRGFVVTAVAVYREVVAGCVVLSNLDRYALVKNWIKFLEHYIDEAFVKSEELGQYEEAKTAVLSSLLDKQQMDLLISHAEKGYYYRFGRPEALFNLLKRMMTSLDVED